MRRSRKFAVLLLAAVASTTWVMLAGQHTGVAQPAARSPDLANGETMFNVGGCAACHQTTGQSDRKRLGGGLALPTKFGTFKVPNISQHPERGIGQWSEAEFANAMLKGVGRKGEHLYPAFPYTSYQRMRAEDVSDLFAYMRTLPADDRASEPHDLSFPYSIRTGLALWKLVNLDGRTFVPDPAKSAELNRGDYLVNGPGHCAECHSTRDFTGAIVADKRFAGGLDAEGKSFVPNITPHADGIGAWSEAEIAEMFSTGYTPGDKVAPPMSEVVENTARLSAEDRKAMAAYLKSLPPRPGKAGQK